uniref:Uncharacterized protein n=1 Tax=Strigamia maritima TaxID=126957 RepID=T1IMR4_STRMM
MRLQTQRKELILAILILAVEKTGSQEKTLNLNGKYSWQLLFDIDNTNNSGHIIRTEEVKVSLFISYDQLLREVQEYAEKSNVGFESGVKLDIISVSMSSGLESSVSQKFESTTTQHGEKREEYTKTTEIKIGPHSRLILYRLVFNGPGISYVTDTLSSTPHDISDVIISCTVRPKNFLKTIDVVYTGDAVSKPSNSLVEVDGLNTDINGGFGGDYVWLVPVWTTNPAEAATSIQVIIQDGNNGQYKDMAKGAGGSYRYVKMAHDSASNERITELKLWRTPDGGSKPSKNGWNYWTGDINANRGGDYLYICWQTVQI